MAPYSTCVQKLVLRVYAAAAGTSCRSEQFCKDSVSVSVLWQNLSDSRVDIKLCLWVPKVKNIWGVFQFCKDSVSVVTCVRFMGRSISNFASEFQKLQIWSVETVQCVLTCSVSDSIQNQLQLHLQRNSSQPRFQPRTSSTDMTSFFSVTSPAFIM